MLLFINVLPLSAVDINTVSAKFHTALESWINNENRTEQMFDMLSTLDLSLDTAVEGPESLIWKSRISFLRGQIYYEQNQKKFSIEKLERCLDLAEKANRIHENSEALSIMAEANSLLILQKGMGFIIKNHSLSIKQAARAL